MTFPVHRAFRRHELLVSALEILGVDLEASALELNQVADLSSRAVAAGGTLAVTAALHNGRVIMLDTAAGSVCTLPAAAGTMARFLFMVKVLATSNSHIVKVTGTDIIQGLINFVDTDSAGTVTGFASAADSDTVTLNRSTKGSVTRGEWLEFLDVASGLWLVRGVLSNSGDAASPFSAAVP